MMLQIKAMIKNKPKKNLQLMRAKNNNKKKKNLKLGNQWITLNL